MADCRLSFSEDDDAFSNFGGDSEGQASARGENEIFEKRRSTSKTFAIGKNTVTVTRSGSKEAARRSSIKTVHRRTSLRTNRHSTPFSINDAPEDEDFEQRLPAMGLFIDYLVRFDPVPEEMHPHDHVFRHMRVRNAANSNKDKWPGYRAAIETVNHEMLFGSIMEDLIVFWKAHGGAAWAFDRSVFMKRAREIRAIKREVVTASVEVQNRVLRLQLAKGKLDYNDETQGERHERHQEFWAQFHEIPRKLEIPRNAEVAVPGIAKHSKHFTRKQTSNWKGVDVRRRSLHDLQWKSQSIRSRCSAARGIGHEVKLEYRPEGLTGQKLHVAFGRTMRHLTLYQNAKRRPCRVHHRLRLLLSLSTISDGGR
jgi:hypothetical protein